MAASNTEDVRWNMSRQSCIGQECRALAATPREIGVSSDSSSAQNISTEPVFVAASAGGQLYRIDSRRNPLPADRPLIAADGERAAVSVGSPALGAADRAAIVCCGINFVFALGIAPPFKAL